MPTPRIIFLRFTFEPKDGNDREKLCRITPRFRVNTIYRSRPNYVIFYTRQIQKLHAVDTASVYYCGLCTLIDDKIRSVSDRAREVRVCLVPKRFFFSNQIHYSAHDREH